MSRDPELLRRYVEGHSETAFSDLVRIHVSLVYATALRLVGGDVHCAQDVTQTVFLDLARKAKALMDRPSLAGWLHTSARFAAAKAVRAEQSRRRWENEAASMESDANSSKDWDQLRAYIDELIDLTGDEHRELILVRYFEKRSFAEIGAMFGVSEEAARKRVDRALEKLRRQCRRRGVVSTAVALGAALQGHAAPIVPESVIFSTTTLASTVTAHSISPGLGGISTFMSLTKVQLGIAAALLFGALGIIKWQRESEASIRRQLNGTIAQLELLRTNSNREIAQSGQYTRQSKLASSSSATGNGASISDALPGDDQARLRTVLNDLRIRFARFIRKYRLTPDQGERLVELLAERQLLDADLRASAMAQGILNPRINALTRFLDRPINQEIQSLLPPEANAALMAYDGSSAIRMVFADRLASSLSDAGAPLNADQTDQLAALVQANLYGIEISPTFGKESVIAWDKVEQAAGTILTPDQRVVLHSAVASLSQQQTENTARLKKLHPY